MLISRLEHRFADEIPEKLEPGILYVSMKYATATHSCCCGCGEEVVTPFTPSDWRMEFNGETISLSPSVGSWTLACRSHYIIRDGKVIEAAPWTEEQVDAGRRREKNAKQQHYGRQALPHVNEAPAPPKSAEKENLLQRLKGWLGL